jgi:hypothetical protein
LVAVVVTVILGRGLVMAAKTASLAEVAATAAALAGVTLAARGGQLNDIINVDHKTDEAHALPLPPMLFLLCLGQGPELQRCRLHLLKGGTHVHPLAGALL